MIIETTYKCDVCGKQIGDPYGPLRLTATAPNTSQRLEEVDVCGIECAAKWLKDLPMKFS